MKSRNYSEFVRTYAPRILAAQIAHEGLHARHKIDMVTDAIRVTEILARQLADSDYLGQPSEREV